MSMSRDFERKASASPYALHKPLEIIGVLREIQEKGVLLQLRSQPGFASILTTVLHIDADRNTVVFDGVASNLTVRLIAAPSAIFETALDKVHVHFTTGPLNECLYEEESALCTEIPAELIRQQRRDFFRVETPKIKPVMCKVTLKSSIVHLPLSDISGGGLCLYDDTRQLDHTIGTIYDKCAIELPEIGLVDVMLRIVQTRELTLPNGKPSYRIGCSYLAPSGATLNTIQRYIGKLEREAIARQRGFG